MTSGLSTEEGLQRFSKAGWLVPADCMTTEEAATRLGIRRDSVSVLAEAGTLRGVKVTAGHRDGAQPPRIWVLEPASVMAYPRQEQRSANGLRARLRGGERTPFRLVEPLRDGRAPTCLLGLC